MRPHGLSGLTGGTTAEERHLLRDDERAVGVRPSCLAYVEGLLEEDSGGTAARHTLSGPAAPGAPSRAARDLRSGDLEQSRRWRSGCGHVQHLRSAERPGLVMYVGRATLSGRSVLSTKRYTAS